MTALVIVMVALAGIFTGGAIAMRRQGRPLSVQLVLAVMAVVLLGLAALLGAFG